MQTYLVVLPVVLTSALSYIVYLLRTQKKERRANSKGTMLLLRVQLIDYHDKWVERGSVSKIGLENYLEMYDAYHDLGGNGLVTELKKEVEALPIKGVRL